MFGNRLRVFASLGALLVLASSLGQPASAHAPPEFTASGPTVTDSPADDGLSTSVTISWSTQSKGLGIILAGTAGNYSRAVAGAGSTSDHHVSVTDLACDRPVRFRILTLFVSGSAEWGPTIDHTTSSCTGATQPAIAIEEVQVIGKERDRLVIGWSTNVDSRGSVLFGPTSHYLLEGPSPMRGTNQFAELVDLECGTTYNYSVIARDENGNSINSGNRTTETSPCATPVVAAIEVEVDVDTATVEIVTDEPSSAEVIHGPTLAYGQATTLDGTSTTHRWTVQDLGCNQTHHMRAKLTGQGGVETVSRDIQFTSGPCPATEPKPAQPLRLMALGDSITMGYQGSSTWRAGVHADLLGLGFDVDMVGSQSGPVWGDHVDGPIDPHHESYVSFTSRRLLGVLHESVADHRPDVALLMIGTNDVIHGRELDAIEADLAEIVKTLRGAKTDVTVVIATVIPCAAWRCGDVNSEIDDLNVRIRRLVPSLDTATSRVAIADLALRFDADRYSDDGIHPDPDGNRILADVWMETLRTLPDFDQEPGAQETASVSNAAQ